MKNKEYYAKNLRNKLGVFILNKRLMANLTQVNLAKQLGISSPEVSQYETGARLPTLIIFFRMIIVFKLSLRDIYEVVTFCKIAQIDIDP